jgi:hypothetical protein
MAIPKEEDYYFQCSLFSLLNFWEFHQLVRLLGVLERVAPPEYFGDSDVVHSDYDCAAIEGWFQQTSSPKEGRPSLELKRSTHPRYSMSVNVGNAVHPHSIHMVSNLRHQPGELEQLFGIADTLAATLDIDFGNVDIYRIGAKPDLQIVSSGSAEHLGLYIDNGPRDVWVRTFFGPRLVALAGGAALATVQGGHWRQLAMGVLAADLTATPWRSTPEELKAAHVEFAPRLQAASGIFATRNGNRFGDDVPGPLWQPPPDARWPDD